MNQVPLGKHTGRAMIGPAFCYSFVLVRWKFALHTLIHTFSFETQLPYFVLDSLGVEV